MSDNEGFLARWFRRKRIVAARGRERPMPEALKESAQPITGAADSKPETDPIVDLANLPPIDSIEAGSDISAFLAPGVPADLMRAALRRAWSADPAIRDFIGLSENSWDFTAPDGVPGFGSVTAEDVRRLLAQLAGDPKTATGSPAPEPFPDDQGLAPHRSAPSNAKEEPDCGAASVALDHRENAGDIALQHEFEEGECSPPLQRRRYGSALPE